MSENLSEIYDEYYYAHGCGSPYGRSPEWLQHFHDVAERIDRTLAPQSVLDAGCAMGLLVESLRKRGVEAYGIDISEFAISQVHEDIKEFCWSGSVAEPFPKTYDLIVTMEVLEHMPPEEAERAIANFCKHAKRVLFSSTPFDFREPTHFNVHPTEEWAEMFAQHGFYRDVDYDASYIAPWGVLFVAKDAPMPRLVRDYERRFATLWRENTDLRSLTVEMRNDLSAAQVFEERSKQQEIQIQLLNMQLIEQARTIEYFQLAAHDEEQEARKANKRVDELFEQLQTKNAHIEYLEHMIQQLQSGRVLRALRTVEDTAQRARTEGPMSIAKQAVARLRKRSEEPVVVANTAPPEDDYARWILMNEPGHGELIKQAQEAHSYPYRPLMSVITPVFNPEPDVLQAAIESVRAQTYDNWQLCLVDGGSTAPRIRKLLDTYAATDSRIQVRYLDQNLGISANSNQALEMVSGEYSVLLDHDDLIAPNALYEIVGQINQDRDTDVVYYDEDKISADGKHRNSPWFKPTQWSPELLLSTNYLMHAAIRTSLLKDLGGFDSNVDGAQDWDLALRISTRTQNVRHVPKVLYHWRQVQGSAASDANAKPWAYPAQERAIKAHLARLGVPDATVDFPRLGMVRIHWPHSQAKVSIIIPTKDKVDLLRACLTSLFERTNYQNFEVVLVDTGSSAPETLAYYAELDQNPRVKRIAFEGPFNYSAANNLGVKHASGDVFLFLNNDTAALEPEWLDELLGWIERPDIGVVGAKLIRPDGTIQHAGIVMGLGGHGSHVFDGEQEYGYGLYGSAEWYRNYKAVTGACMMVRRSVFEQLGGFDEAYQVGYNDIDLCLRALDLDLRVVYTPFARLLHHEGATRNLDQPPSDVLRASMLMLQTVLDGDDYFSPNLSLFERKPTLRMPDEKYREPQIFSVLRLYDLVEKRTPTAKDRLGGQFLEMKVQLPEDNRKKLALFSHDLSLTGAPQILFKLAQRLVLLGYHVTVFSPIGGAMKLHYEQENIPVVIEPGLLDDARVAFGVVKHFDGAIINTILGWRAVFATVGAAVPCIWWIHESQFGLFQLEHHPQIGQALAAADLVMFPSQATADLYREYTVPGRARGIHFGLDLDAEYRPESPFKSNSERLAVVTIGSVERRKGQDTLIKAIAALPPAVREQFDFYIVGRVNDWNLYTDVLRRAREFPNVHVVGEVLHERAMSYLINSDIFVCSSRDEALPIVVVEAMCYGKAVVTTRAGGVAEVIEDGHNGFVVEVDDHEAIAQALIKLANDRELIKQFGERSSEIYQSHLRIERFQDDVANLLDDLIK
jgi:glycosyltransferase involved in cell wall biosynthesis/SAM-dependent methyltransferase